MGFLEEYQRHMATQRHWKGCVAILFYKWPSDLLFFSYCNVLHVLALGVSLVFFHTAMFCMFYNCAFRKSGDFKKCGMKLGFFRKQSVL